MQSLENERFGSCGAKLIPHFIPRRVIRDSRSAVGTMSRFVNQYAGRHRSRSSILKHSCDIGDRIKIYTYGCFLVDEASRDGIAKSRLRSDFHFYTVWLIRRAQQVKRSVELGPTGGV